ncbi:hypothetical protein QYM36_008515, partial [Artemia franciscana]
VLHHVPQCSRRQILQEFDKKQFNSTRNSAVEPTMLHDTECPGSSSNSEQDSTEDWRSTGNSVEQSEQDSCYLPVLATTGNPPKTQAPQAADQSVPEAHHHHHAEPGYEAAPVAQPAYGGTLDGQQGYGALR